MTTLTPAETAVLRLLSDQGFASTSAIATKLHDHGVVPSKDAAHAAPAINRMRGKLRPYGVEIRATGQRGYHLPETAKTVARQLVGG